MRNLHLWFAVGMSVSLAGLAFAVLKVALSESLWLDELHTSWCVSATWQEIANRAASGNQTPLYFWLIAIVSQTLGDSFDWILRLPSAFAWLMAVSLLAWKVHSKVPQDSRSWLFAVCIVAWIVLDRLQWFFASEARPYAFVQLLSLAGWCCVESIIQSENRSNRDGAATSWKLNSGSLIFIWCILSVTNIYLHLTAALPVLFQWLVAFGIALRSPYERRSRATMPWILAAAGVGLALLPILQLAFPVWQRRGQWAAFASDVSIQRATSMFPFVPVLLCVLMGCMVDRLVRSKGQVSSITTEVRWLWWTAMLGPWFLAWTVTALGIAPMFHQRFVFSSAMPLYLVGAIELLRCRNWTMRWVTCLAVALAIVFSQGSFAIWRAGYLVGNLRGEDWRAATQWVNGQLAPGEPILCSSGLIEADANSTHALSIPLEPGFAEYLSFPLLGIYHLNDSSGRIVPVTPLLGDHRRWAAQVSARISEEQTRVDRLWMFYRGAPGRLKSKLADFQLDLKTLGLNLESSEPKRFGNLFVVELKQPSSSR